MAEVRPRTSSLKQGGTLRALQAQCSWEYPSRAAEDTELPDPQPELGRVGHRTQSGDSRGTGTARQLLARGFHGEKHLEALSDPREKML